MSCPDHEPTSDRPPTPNGDQGDHGHIPVLLDHCLAALAPKPRETFVDCTAGRGGHAVAFARAVGPTGRVILFDIDAENLAHAATRVRNDTGREPLAVHANFAGITSTLHGLQTDAPIKADVVLADLGFSSTQMDDPRRGFSFGTDGPLDMRLDSTAAVTAAELLRTLPESDLADLIFRYGEEPFARRIARKVVAIREEEPIESTAQLARLVREAYGPRAHQSRLHPATRTFMALRIAVNDELGALRSLLHAIETGAMAAADGDGHDDSSWLRAGARIGIISFHSLEDRLVKVGFVDMQRRGLLQIQTRKPLVSSESEAAENPRARSAKLRVAMVGVPLPAR
ncbi:MAG: 16S rRNA (cytosine(1402)-N(4))-methyltransferase RsmH [Phycisphaerae bacterium]|nr:16S rRNA (cytosine(1402)-N(4))-methyltransferase RsmH [Phycisphaerae bacterium]